MKKNEVSVGVDIWFTFFLPIEQVTSHLCLVLLYTLLCFTNRIIEKLQLDCSITEGKSGVFRNKTRHTYLGIFGRKITYIMSRSGGYLTNLNLITKSDQ